MHLAHGRILAGGRLTQGQQEAARHGRTTSAEAFSAGLRTLREHARFTPLGAELIDSAARYMNAAAGISAEPATETASS
jgi:hypothetical protein